VFGLRKSGKTSLITELGRRFHQNEPNRVFVFCDLETLPKASPRLGIEFVQDLRQALLLELRPRNVKTGDLNDLEMSASVGDLRRALAVSLADCRNKGIQVVLALDEVESLAGDSETLSKSSRPEVPEILGALRSLVQENKNFNVVLSGITSALIHRGELYGVENPLFSWARVAYVPPMKESEIKELTREVGHRMGLSWNPDALDALFAESEGNVFLHRSFASMVVGRLETENLERVVRKEDVLATKRAWRRSIAEKLLSMMESTERHYPNECAVLESFIEGIEPSRELETNFPVEVQRLIDLNLLQEDRQGQLRLGSIAKHLQAVRGW